MALLVSIYIKIYWLIFNLPFSLVWTVIQLAVFLSPLCLWSAWKYGLQFCTQIPSFYKNFNVKCILDFMEETVVIFDTHTHTTCVYKYTYIFKVLEIPFPCTEINLWKSCFKTLLLLLFLKLCIRGAMYTWGRMLAEPEASGPLLLQAGAMAVVSHLLWVLGTEFTHNPTAVFSTEICGFDRSLGEPIVLTFVS